MSPRTEEAVISAYPRRAVLNCKTQFYNWLFIILRVSLKMQSNVHRRQRVFLVNLNKNFADSVSICQGFLWRMTKNNSNRFWTVNFQRFPPYYCIKICFICIGNLFPFLRYFLLFFLFIDFIDEHRLITSYKCL